MEESRFPRVKPINFRQYVTIVEDYTILVTTDASIASKWQEKGDIVEVVEPINPE